MEWQEAEGLSTLSGTRSWETLMLEIRDVVVQYGAVRALKEISLTVTG